MKPFDLEAAKRGEPIQTRDGRKARFIAHVPECHQLHRVLALVDGETFVQAFTEAGRYAKRDDSAEDLFMAPKKRTVWVNLYYDRLLPSCWYYSEEYANRYAGRRIGNRAYPVEIEE